MCSISILLSLFCQFFVRCGLEYITESVKIGSSGGRGGELIRKCRGFGVAELRLFVFKIAVCLKFNPIPWSIPNAQ